MGSLVEVQQTAKPKIEILETSSRIPWSGHSAKHVIENIYENISVAGMSIIFVNTRAQAEFLFQELWQINDNHRRIAPSPWFIRAGFASKSGSKHGDR